MPTFRGARTDPQQRRALQGLKPWLVPTPSKTAAYTARYGEMVLCNPTAGGFTVTAPRAEDHTGETFGVKNNSASTNAIVVDAQGTELIDGAANQAITTGRMSLIFMSNGTDWMIV
jgi:hypothetical protein